MAGRELKSGMNLLNIVPIFLLGTGPNLIGEDRIEQKAKTEEIIKKLGMDAKPKFLIRKEEELNDVRVKDTDVFIVFPYCTDRFTPLIHLADSKLPMIIVGENSAFNNALDTYEYLADHPNVEIVFTAQEVKAKLTSLEAANWVKTAKVCVFGLETEESVGKAWCQNPIALGKMNTHNVPREELFSAYKSIRKMEAEKLARKWAEEGEVREPSLEDIAKSARVYLAMKKIVEDAKADAAYVYLCGNFTKGLGTKMCFAMAKLADDGLPVGCWRGENLLPMLILHAASKKPIFVCEADKHSGSTTTLRHCFAPCKIANCKYVLRRWRNMEGTVTGYVQLPRGQITLVNSGIGDKIVVVKAEAVDCKDLGNETCRMTVRVRLKNENIPRKFVGREFAMVYGDYLKEAKEIGAKLGLAVFS